MFNGKVTPRTFRIENTGEGGPRFTSDNTQNDVSCMC